MMKNRIEKYLNEKDKARLDLIRQSVDIEYKTQLDPGGIFEWNGLIWHAMIGLQPKPIAFSNAAMFMTL